ncbi:MAG: DUF1573 domain-containing protein [Bacteroidota bacterium]
MKFIGVLICVGVLAMNAMGQSGNRKNTGGVIWFAIDKFNFGEVKEEGGSVSHRFTFKNAGKGPLRIVNVLTTCGCTTSDWTQTAINPGDSGYITATFDPKNRPGRFSRTLTIITNGIPESAVLTLEGSVGSANREMLKMFPHEQGNLRFSTNEFNVTALKEDKMDSLWLGVYNPTSKNLIIRTVISPYAMRVETKNLLLAPESGDNILMTYNAAMVKQLGPKRDTVHFVTSDDSMPNKFIVVKANIVQNFDKLTAAQRLAPPVISVAKTVVNVGELYLGEKGTYTFEITNKGKSDLIIRRLMGADASITAKASTMVVKKGAKAKITVTLNSKDLHGAVEKSMTVITNDPVNSYTVLKLTAKVVIPGIEPIGK